MIRRLLPHPLLALALLGIWLLLTQSISPGQILLGTAAALLATHAFAALFAGPPVRVHLRPVFKLAGLVAVDILRSNIAVAAIVLFRRRDRVADFINVPIVLQNRQAIACLALIVTATPGTLWVDFDRRRGILLLHVLDLVDEETWIRLIKDRYEALLMEIFER
ncbi:Na+/H+ antiporter subunit E [Sphingomonas sp.]|jgi:multicomponent K+:H+ antiporter subunit E|uniref:Na+/H+ antiporter subunit E n=1 Tax=Sphingomonas sp. TaxID=28214 RepID=UPI0026316D8A|nr:Na+/H+ antiporter subunit E [Sphingomonas sp.]MDF2493727.1 cation:proton antiporter [Sphingomonas sp.]